MKKKEKVLFILFVILCSLMLCDAVFMFCKKEFYDAIKDIVFGIGFGCIGLVYLFSSKRDE